MENKISSMDNTLNNKTIFLKQEAHLSNKYMQGKQQAYRVSSNTVSLQLQGEIHVNPLNQTLIRC